MADSAINVQQLADH